MKVLFICGREPTYTRNAILLKALRKNFEVIECINSARNYLLRYLVIFTKFLFKYRKADLIFIGFLGQPLVPLIRLFTKKPIIFDAFLSVYDTMCFDRKKFKAGSILGKLCYWLDRTSCIKVDKVLLDTKTYQDYFIKTFKLPKEKFDYVYVGADETFFYPRENIKKENDKFAVFYYGTGLPLQGIDIILKAAKLLEDEKDILFRMVGPIRKKYKNLIKLLSLKNIEFIDWLPYEKLPFEIAKADICLGGHFSNIGKAKRVIAGKTFQFLAMKKPVIVGDNEANKELFIHKENVYMCKMADEKALASTILELKSNPLLRKRVADKGYKIFVSNFNSDIRSEEIKNLVLIKYR